MNESSGKLDLQAIVDSVNHPLGVLERRDVLEAQEEYEAGSRIINTCV